MKQCGLCASHETCYACARIQGADKAKTRSFRLPHSAMNGFVKTRSPKNNCWSTTLGLVFLFLFLQGALVWSGRAATSTLAAKLPGPYASQFTIADYDGDSLPDLASVQFGESGSRDTRYLIEFRLTGGLHETLAVTGPTGGLQLKSRDVNGDTFPDVVVTSFWTSQPVAVLLNDGKGNFTPSAPSAFPAAFNASETSFRQQAPTSRDAVAELFTRDLSGDCGQCGRADAPEIIARCVKASAFLPFTSSDRGSSFGRAPPRSISL